MSDVTKRLNAALEASYAIEGEHPIPNVET